MRRILGMLLIATLAAVSSWADIPRTINYQGRLTDLTGNPVSDTGYSITVRLYDSAGAAEGASIWSDVYSVQTKNGYFNILLGSTPSFPLNLAFDRPYWIGVHVSGDSNEMSPRQPLSSVPYALNIEVPVGTILPWHKNFFSAPPALPACFIECNGQLIADSESPFYNQHVPDLNGEGRFLRGGSTSGAQQDDTFQGHLHARGWTNVGGSNWGPTLVNSLANYDSGTVSSDQTTNYVIGNPISNGTSGTPRTSNETRPKNMSIIWIMKIK